MENKVYDIAGIGIGPFNLGLAALAQPINNLDCIFFDKNPSFSWHPGMMMDFAKLQVPFYADLVTGADPSNRFSFFCYLKQTGRLFQFAILEDNYITRKEYNDYCCWVAAQLDNLFFGEEVVEIDYDNLFEIYKIKTVSSAGGLRTIHAKHIVLGVGATPFVPDFIKEKCSDSLFHSSRYLEHRKQLLKKKNIVIIGSGQSAAEIFYDTLRQAVRYPQKIEWITRAERIFPMDISKFSLEMASPDFIDYFHSLPIKERREKLRRQDMLYKGINQELLTEIYRLLYHNSEKDVVIRTGCEVKQLSANGVNYDLSLFHTEQGLQSNKIADCVVLATGYHRPQPKFIHGVKSRIRWEDGEYLVNRNYSIDENQKEIFVQNADLHSHGFNAPDLGLGPYRNAVILNAILGEDYFMVERKIAYQAFGL